MSFPDDETEFGRCWSSAAGELAGLKEAIAEAEKRSAEAFIRRQDAVANALRDLALSLTSRRDGQSALVQGYIEEDKKRKYQMRKMVGGR